MKKLICFLLTFVVAVMPLTGCIKVSGSSDTSHDNLGDELIALKNGPELTGDALNTSVYGDVLKIDDITTGLNTYTMKTTLYSLTEQKILGQTVSLPESDWNTGCFDGGFYAAALDRCELILYDNECNEIMRKQPAGTGSLWAFAAVSPDRKYLLYGDAQAAEIYVYSLEDDSQKRVGIFSGYIDVAGFSNGCFYLRSGDGALVRVDPEKERSEVAFVDIRLNFVTPYYSLGKTEVNFMVMSPEQTSFRYTEMLSVDEVPIAAGEPGFITSASEAENDILRVYRVKDAEMFTVKVPDTVRWVCFDEERLVIAAEDKITGKTKLYLNTARSSKTTPVVFYDTDQMPSNDNLPEIPDPEPSKPDESESSSSEPAVPSAKKRIDGVPIIAQMPKYPTGCESVTAVMALQFAGEKITVDEFIDKYLEKSSDFYNVDGVRYGPNPYEIFVGSPRSRSAFGCMAPVIENALVKFYSSNQPVKNTTGKNLEELCREYIDKGTPVMVWITIKMIEPYYTSRWNLPNSETYTWLANEHCMLLIGYDQDNYYFNDPYTGKEVKYGKSLSQKRYDAFGMQSLVVSK